MDLREIKEFFKDTIGYILVAIFIIFVVLYIVSLQQVIGPSMSPTLNDGDVLLLNKFVYSLREIERNEVIAFDYDDSKYLIKRVIGLPGEKIEYKDNILYIDDEAYQEKITDDLITDDFSLQDMGHEVIPEDMYLVLGDNRGDSLDSRSFGLIKKDDIIGKPFVRIWPLNQFNLVK
ncbi:MAG: signal peptidase I [Bacilli bacterium]|nr:signal peptidase I [Bacilli bacterium]